MGGRGGSGGSSGVKSSRNSGAIIATESRVISTTYFDYSRSGNRYSTNRYKDTVLEATENKNGELVFSYATPKFYPKDFKTNVKQKVEFNVKAGAVNGQTFGIDWSKVTSVSGQTFGVKDAAKKAGLSWDGTNKKWVRKT